MVNLESRGVRIGITVLVVIIILLAFAASMAAVSGFGLPKAGGFAGTIKVGCIAYTKGNPYYEESQEIKKGLELWAEHVNGPGISVSGKKYKVELVCKEASSTDRNDLRLAVDSLATKEKVNVIVAPPGNSLASVVVEIAENRHVPTILTYTDNANLFIVTGTKPRQYVFMLMAPIGTQISYTLKMLNNYNITYKNVAILYEQTSTGDAKLWAGALSGTLTNIRNVTITYNHPFTKENASAVVGAMVSLKANPNVIFVSAETTDGLVAVLGAISNAKAQITTLKHVIVAAPGTAMAAAEDKLGAALDRVIYISMWEPIAPISPFMAANLGLDWYGYTTSEDFYLSYIGTYGKSPTYLAALGYTAGLLIQYAYEKSGSLDPTVIADTIRSAKVMTFYGAIGFDTGGQPGLQILHDPILVEYVQTGAGLKKIIVWPEQFVTENYVPPG